MVNPSTVLEFVPRLDAVTTFVLVEAVPSSTVILVAD